MTLWNCNVSDTGETFAINVKLNDSLAVEDSIFKSVTIAIYDGNGNLVQADVFKGEYHKSDAAKLANLPLAAKPPEPFEIRITAYKKNSTDSWVFKTLISNGTPQPLPPVHNTVPESTATVLPTRVLIVNPVSHTLYLADSAISLVAKVEPATAPAAITWSLSNADVAVIGIDGKIRGLMAGTVVLKAASTGTPAVFDTATLTVKPQPTALPASVQISNPHPLLLTEGGASSKLDAVVHPDEASQGIVWTSLAPDVAVIEPGNLIKGLKAGTALVKAASTVTPTVFDTLTVMVSGQVTIAPVSVAITNTNPLLLTVGGGTVKLKANVLPVDASQAVVWTSSATDIAGIDSGNVLKGLKAGTTKVTVASAGNPSISATLDVTVQEAPAVLPTAIIPKAATLALQVGDPAVNLEAAVIPAEASQGIIWSLEAAGVVEIVGTSQLRALKAGTAKVIATSAVKATVTATITVSVTAPIVIPDSIALRMPVPMTLAPNGATSDISWAIVPAAADQSVEWSSSDIAVAQITTDNKVKSVAIGKATITGKSKAKPALTISFQVNVIKAIKVDAITLTPKTLKLYTGGADGQLGVAMTGNDTGAQYSLSSSNALIASVNAAGAVKGVKAGSAVITAAVVGYPAISSVCSVTVITDPPVVTVTPDQTVDYGGEASFSVAVKQDYGTTAEIKADMDGNGTFEKSVLAKDSATFKATYSEAKIFTLNFEVKDSEGNVVALTRKVTVTAVAAPVVKITDPATAITVNTATYTVKFTVKDPTKAADEAKDSVVTLVSGANTIKVSRSNPGGVGSASVVITLDNSAPGAPTVTHPSSPSNVPKPTWSWTGTGPFEYRLTNSATSTAVGTAIAASPYSPLTALAEATWYFQVRERDAIGNWSDWSIARGVVLDLTGPAAPTVTGPVTPTRVTLPTWTWSGTGPFEIRYGTVNPPTTNVTPLTTGTFTPTKVLTDGTWYFQARESDALGNWGPWSASSSVVIKASAPTAPTVTPNKAVTNAPSWSWIKGSGGNGTFRYRWSGSPTYLNSNSTLPMSFALDVAASKDGSYTLCVAERDVVDWGAEGCATAVTFDKTKPVLSNISIPDGFVTNATSVTVKYDLDGATGQTSSYACSLTDGASTDCSKTVSDAAGNSGGTGTLKVWSRQKVIFVKAGVTGGDGSSWDKAYSDIQVGVAAIPSDGKPWEVWVSAAANAYQSFRFDRSNVSILGGFSATGRPNVNTDRSPSTNLSKIQNFYIGTSDPIPSSNITIDGFHVVDSKSASVGPDVTIFAVKNASIRNLWMENLTEGGNYGLITIWGGSVSLESVFLRGNHSAAHSAIYVYGESPQVSINKSEISGNTSDNASAADQATAGIFIDQTDGGKITIRNSTVSDNKIVDNNPLNGLANGGTIDISNSNVKGGRVTFGPYNEIDTPINWGTNCDPAATGCPTRP